MRRAIILATSLAAASPAAASGGLWCNAEDGKVVLSVESGITRGLGNPLFNFHGTLDIKDKAVAADLLKSAFEQSHLTQHWLDDKQLNMQLYRERGGDGAVGEIDLLIETKSTDEGSYAGTYELRVSDMTGATGEPKVAEFKGPISCGAE